MELAYILTKYFSTSFVNIRVLLLSKLQKWVCAKSPQAALISGSHAVTLCAGRLKAKLKTCSVTVNKWSAPSLKLWHQSTTYAFIMAIMMEISDDWALSPFLLLSPLFRPLPLVSPPSSSLFLLSSLASSVLLKEAGAYYRCLTLLSRFPSSSSSLSAVLSL